jgi:predicted nucleotidyltransferase
MACSASRDAVRNMRYAIGDMQIERTTMTTVTGRHTELERICREFGVAILYVFGSRADEVREWLEGRETMLVSGPSDVDIGVQAAPGVHWSIKNKVLLAIELEDLLGCNRVDLVVLNTADPFLAEEVIRGERLYATDEYEADEYDLYVLRRAGDQAPLEREWLAQVLEVKT